MAAFTAQRLKKIVEGPEEKLNLAHAALLIAYQEYPGLDISFYLKRLDDMASVVRGRVSKQATVADRLFALNWFLFDEQGFTGNADDYYDPRNSFLNEVLDRRSGIPITLSLVYIEIGWRLGLPLEGVLFPGHFLVKCAAYGRHLIIDPFSEGAQLQEEDLMRQLQQVYGVENPPKDALVHSLASAGKKDILVRMLRNLKGIYFRNGQMAKALSMLDHILLIMPELPGEMRDRGLLYQHLECFQAALVDFRRYLEISPFAGDAGDIRGRIIELQRAKLN